MARSFLPTYGKLFAVVGFLLFALRALFLQGKDVLFAAGPLSVSVESLMGGLSFAFVVMAMCGVLTLFFALVPAKLLMLALEELGVSPKATYGGRGHSRGIPRKRPGRYRLL
ncbi:hypothetical protein [Arthrobacter sp. NyZ413]|uniref:hypothetical protein n=1 Tax=Arthrobacter sp. NyZ413 TaxID=3144669 RepID=UPI003BF847A6